MPPNKDKIKSLISKGSQITGATAGGIAGFLIGGPAGAALEGPLGVIFNYTLFEMANRLLSNREEIRVGAAAEFARIKIKSRLDSGESPRNDGFFQDKGTRRADAKEIFEGVLLKAKNEHEEKKIKIIGNIFANVAFLPGFSVGDANHLLQVAENLTYRKMCILSLIKRKGEIQGIKLREANYSDYWQEPDKGITLAETVSTVQEAYEMYGLGLILCKDKTDKGSLWSMTEWTDIAPNGLKLTPMGERYYQVMGLYDIPEEDIREVARHLT